MPPEDAQWFYDTFSYGDIVQVTGTSTQLAPDDGYGDWNIPWDQWLQGSALNLTRRRSDVSRAVCQAAPQRMLRAVGTPNRSNPREGSPADDPVRDTRGQTARRAGGGSWSARARRSENSPCGAWPTWRRRCSRGDGVAAPAGRVSVGELVVLAAGVLSSAVLAWFAIREWRRPPGK